MDGTDNPPAAAGSTSLVDAPFTRAERIEQLAGLDHDITTLLAHTGAALRSLSAAPPGPAPGPAQQQTEAFKAAVDAFLATLHSVDVRLKRQIMGLEEAGIVTLRAAPAGGGGGAAAAGAPGAPGGPGGPAAPSIEPNGVGSIGGLDVGWLNSRGNKVERDMEAELWTRARAHLEGLVAAGGGGGGGAEDVEMR